MIKRRYFYIPTIVLIIVFAFKLQSFINPHNTSKYKKSELKKTPKQSHLNEIEDIVNKYDSIISSEIKKSGTIGAAIVITYKNEVALLKCFGVQKKGEKNAINKNTVFRLASVSKPVTGVLAGILADEGTIKLNDKVIEYLPNFKLKNTENTQQITIAHLLSHASGLVPHAYDGMVEDHVSIGKIMKKLDEVDIAAAPGILYGYQNVMFSLYDTIARAKTSKDYSTLIDEKVFEPFGMKDASTNFSDFKNNKNKAYPHFGGNGIFHPINLNNKYYNTAPAAGVNASIADMSQFLLTLLDDKSSAIDDNVRELIFTPQIKSPLSYKYLRRWEKVQSKHYSLGWRIIGYKNRKVAYHGGYVRGYRAEIALCEEEEIGIAFLSNSPTDVGSKTVPTFLNLFFKLKDKEAIPNS